MRRHRQKIAHIRRRAAVAAAASQPSQQPLLTTTFIITMPSPTTSNPAMPRLQAAPMPATDASPSSRLGRVIERLQSLSPIPNCEDAAAEAHLCHAPLTSETNQVTARTREPIEEAKNANLKRDHSTFMAENGGPSPGPSRTHCLLC